jgi:hypothetical protein
VTGTLQGALFRKRYQRDQPQSDVNREGGKRRREEEGERMSSGGGGGRMEKGKRRTQSHLWSSSARDRARLRSR